MSLYGVLQKISLAASWVKHKSASRAWPGFQRIKTGVSQSRHHGGFSGLSPPNKVPSPPNWNVKHYRWNFGKFYNVKSPPHKHKALPQNCKALLLKTFWRRFWSELFLETACTYRFSKRSSLLPRSVSKHVEFTESRERNMWNKCVSSLKSDNNLGYLLTTLTWIATRSQKPLPLIALSVLSSFCAPASFS